MRLKLISCEIFFREVCALAARAANTIDLEFLPKGLHDLGSAPMLARVQTCVDAVDPGVPYDAVLLGYGLCNNGLAGLRARHVPLIVPRAHDCITLFLGDRRRYQDYFAAHPGTYFHTSGWLERGSASGELQELSIQHRTGMDRSYEELVEAYGEDNAKYLFETLCEGLRNYGRYTFVRMGVEPDDRFERESEQRAAEKGWKFEVIPGDMGLLERLLDGPWDEAEFLRVPPGMVVRATHEEGVVAAAPAEVDREEPAARPTAKEA